MTSSNATARKRGSAFLAKRALLVLAVAAVVLVVAGAIYQAVATEIDQRSVFPAPGEMVGVQGHRLHLNCVGDGSPTVVLEAGGGYTSVEWSAWIQPEVASKTRVCAYDRAGTGWSEPEPGSADAAQIAGELHTLLSGAGEDGPFVLVGHSLGGLYERVYADRFPEDIAGMVLVDSSHPAQFERLGTESTVVANRVAGVVGPPLARLGVPRLLDLFPPSPDLPSLQRDQRRRLYYTTPHLVATFEELGEIPATLRQGRSTGTLENRPLAVVSAADHGTAALADSEIEARRMEREIQGMQAGFTSLSSDSTHRVIEGSTHVSLVVQQSHAKQTSAEILRVVDAVRTGRTLGEQSPRGRTGQ